MEGYYYTDNEPISQLVKSACYKCTRDATLPISYLTVQFKESSCKDWIR